MYTGDYLDEACQKLRKGHWQDAENGCYPAGFINNRNDEQTLRAESPSWAVLHVAHH